MKARAKRERERQEALTNKSAFYCKICSSVLTLVQKKILHFVECLKISSLQSGGKENEDFEQCLCGVILRKLCTLEVLRKFN